MARRFTKSFTQQEAIPEAVIDRVGDILRTGRLHRYNVATLELMENSVQRWARELSSPGRPVTPYFIQVRFRDIQQPERQRFFNQVPTSFSLTDEQVDELIAAGRELLRNDPDFQRFLAGLGGTRAPGG